MTVVLRFRGADVLPSRDAALERMGIPAGAELAEPVESSFARAAELLIESAAPAGVMEEISGAEFGEVYRGEGRNDPASPVADIFGRADHLALFAVTLGEGVSEALARCFAGEELAIAYLLDAMASVAADGIADLAERRFDGLVRGRGWNPADGAVLRYSPGYCGWDVTGQRKLFAHLDPARIGLSLTEGCLMRPLKSVSGVAIAGPREIHVFAPEYDACRSCRTRTCLGRHRALASRERS